MDLKLYSTLGNTEVLNERITITDTNQFDFLFGINFNHWINDKWGLMLNSDLGIAGDNVHEDGIKYKVDMIQSGPTLGWAFTF